MLRTAEYKYIYSAPHEQEYLFDHVHDPQETRSRASNPSCSAKTRELRERINEIFSGDGYTDPIEGGSWRRFGRKSMPADPEACLLFQDPPGSIPHIPRYETDSNSRRYFEFHWYEDRYDTV